MKTSLKIAIVLCSLILGSCQTDIAELDQKVNTGIDTKEGIERIDQSLVPYGTHFFERQLQWVAYLSAKVILHDKDARDEIEHLLSENKVAINTLILPDSEAVHFREAFMDELHHYFWNGIGESIRGPGEDTPPSGISPCCAGPSGYPSLNASQFMDVITLDHCIELYFPIELTKENTSDPEIIASTGHPLSTSDENYGYIRYKDPILDEEGSLTYTQVKTIDPNFLENKIITVLARPYRASRSCLYKDYAYVGSFETFLNND